MHPRKEENEDDKMTKKIIQQTTEEMSLIPSEKFIDACFNVSLFFFTLIYPNIYLFLAISFVKTASTFYFAGKNDVR